MPVIWERITKLVGHSAVLRSDTLKFETCLNLYGIWMTRSGPRSTCYVRSRRTMSLLFVDPRGRVLSSQASRVIGVTAEGSRVGTLDPDGLTRPCAIAHGCGHQAACDTLPTAHFALNEHHRFLAEDRRESMDGAGIGPFCQKWSKASR